MNENKKHTSIEKKDWHNADIVAELHKSGWSLRKLSTHLGYKEASTLSVALHRPWPKGEQIIANAIGVLPQIIWPSRYALRDKTNTNNTYQQ